MAIVHSEETDTGKGILAVAWLFLLVAAVVWGLANQQLDIDVRASQALASAELEGTVSVDGRDVMVSGVPAGSSARVVEVVESIEGVRSVAVVESPVVAAPSATAAAPPPLVGTTVSPPSSATPTAPPAEPQDEANIAYVSARLQAGALTIDGVVSSEETAQRVAAVAELIYAPFLTNGLEVDPSVEPVPWADGIAGSIAVLPIVGAASLTIEGDEAVLSGSAPSDIRAEQLRGAVQQALGRTVVVQPRIAITGLDSPRFEGRTTADGSVVLSGVVPSAQIAAAITESVTASYGAERVIDEIEVTTGVDATFSLYRLPIALRLFAPFDAWEVVIEGDAISGTLRGGASFATGSARLTPELTALLDIGAGILLRNPTLAMTIEGHTDSVGTAASNQRLSVARANAAAEYLVAAGLAPQRLTPIGYGETNPIADNNTTEGRAKNRRIEFALGPASGGES